MPYELLNKKFCSAQKAMDREVSQVQAAANEFEKIDLRGDRKGVPAGNISRLLGGVVAKLQVLKRKAQESIAEELQAGIVYKQRWRRQRLDRICLSERSCSFMFERSG